MNFGEYLKVIGSMKPYMSSAEFIKYEKTRVEFMKSCYLSFCLSFANIMGLIILKKNFNDYHLVKKSVLSFGTFLTSFVV